MNAYQRQRREERIVLGHIRLIAELQKALNLYRRK